MNDDQLMKQWAEDFRVAGPQIPEISRSARKSVINWYLEMGAITAASLGAIVYMVYGMLVYNDLWFNVIGVALIPFCLVSSIASFVYRHGKWKVVEETPRGLLRLLRKQEETRLREHRFLVKPSIVFLALTVVFLVLRLRSEWNESVDVPIYYIVVTILAFAAIVGSLFFMFYLTRRQQNNLEKVALLEKSFDNGLE